MIWTIKKVKLNYYHIYFSILLFFLYILNEKHNIVVNFEDPK